MFSFIPFRASRTGCIGVLLGLLILFAPLPFFGHFNNTNSTVRLALLSAMVEDGTTQIDPYQHLTIDKAQHDGHYYSDKAPGMTFLAVPAYLALRQVGAVAGIALHIVPDSGMSSQENTFRRGAMRLIVLSTSGLATALAGAAFIWLATQMTGSLRAAAAAGLAVFLGTPLLGWSINFFGHAATAGTLFLAFFFCFRISPDRWRWPGFLAGLCLGLTVALEYTAAPAVAMVALYGVWRAFGTGAAHGFSATALALLGCALTIAPVLIYHTVSFGGPFSVGYSNVVGFEGMNEGFLGLTAPDPAVLYEITLGLRRGLVWISPICLLLPVAAWYALRDRHYRAEYVLCLLIVIYYLLFNASYYYWDGGGSLGPRHLTPALPFAGLLLCSLWIGTGPVLRALATGLVILSVALGLLAAGVTMTPNGEIGFPILQAVLLPALRGETNFVVIESAPALQGLIILIWLVIIATLALTFRRTLIEETSP